MTGSITEYITRIAGQAEQDVAALQEPVTGDSRRLLAAAFALAAAEAAHDLTARLQATVAWHASKGTGLPAVEAAIRGFLFDALTVDVGDTWSGREANPIARVKFAAKQDIARKIMNWMDY